MIKNKPGEITSPLFFLNSITSGGIFINGVWCKYRVEFGFTDGKKGAYLGDTVEELHRSIDSDRRLEDYVWIRDTLKYGYFGEFHDSPYVTKEYTIDNCMCFVWIVK